MCDLCCFIFYVPLRQNLKFLDDSIKGKPELIFGGNILRFLRESNMKITTHKAVKNTHFQSLLVDFLQQSMNVP